MFNIDIAMSAGQAGLTKAFEIKQTNYQVFQQNSNNRICGSLLCHVTGPPIRLTDSFQIVSNICGERILCHCKYRLVKGILLSFE